jgi:putative ABC transport system substrate-binding protein
MPSAKTIGIPVVAALAARTGSDFIEAHRQVGLYVGRILAGEKAGDLPVQLGAKFEFTINMKAAKAMGVDIAPTLLARADAGID